MKNAIFVAFDERYAIFAQACLNSIRKNYPEHPEIIAFYNGDSPATLSFLRSCYKLTLIDDLDVVRMAGEFGLGVVNSQAIFYKYFAWSDTFSQFDKVMYLDVDTLVLKPLDELFAGNEFLIVPNHEPESTVRVFLTSQYDCPELISLLNQDRLTLMEGMDDMCNAGVFVIPRRYRTKEQCAQLLDLTRRYNQFLRYADQSAISLWCKLNNIAYTARFEFNFQTPHFKSDLAGYNEDNVFIIHFSSPLKPNTFDFMRWGRIDIQTRKRLARLFFRYLYDQEATRYGLNS